MIRYLILSILAYYIFHYIIVPMIGKPNQEKKTPPRYREDDSIRHYRDENKPKKSTSKDDDYADYEEIK